ncbi:MAG: energy transducer TonB [Oscillibacter sp.]|nr:energy transducer TonB [Oscillibacter sp.]
MMKMILLFVLVTMTCTVFGQGKTPHSENFDVVKYVNDYVQKKMAEIPPKSEFETMKEWQERRNEQKQLYIHDALYELYGDPRGEKVNLKLGKYNAEKEYFPVETNGFGSYICLARYYARSIKEDWSKKGLGYMYALIDGEVRLVGSMGYPYFYPLDEETGEIYDFHWENGEWISGLYEYNYRRSYDELDKVHADNGWRKVHAAENVDEKPFFTGDLSTWLKTFLRKVDWENTYSVGRNVCFIVEKNGSISPSKTYTKDEFYWSKSVIKNMPRWNPGKIKGKAVATEITIDAYELILEKPTFPGNMKQWLYDNLKYPAQARKNGKSVRINITAIVHEDGSITTEASVKDCSKKENIPFVKEAIRLVKAMPKWNPAKRCGTPIGYKVRIPIEFKLNQ